MKKLLSFTLLACGLLLMSHKAEAVGSRSPKEVFVSSYTTGPIQVTPSVSTNSASQYMPGAIYQVTLSTGASGEYEVLFDSATCQGLTLISIGNLPASTYQNLGPKLLYSSTTAGTVYTFDPPIRFDQGLCIFDSAATGQAAITYELGRGLSGQ